MGIRVVLLVCGLFVLTGVLEGQENVTPDAVFLNGIVVPMTGKEDRAQAIAVKDGKILAVGTTEQIRARAGASTKVVDLGGKTVLPGFYAAHDHFPGAGRVALFSIDLNSPPIGPMESIEDIIAALKAKAEKTPKGSWVVGRGYDDTLLKEHRHPTRQDLDRASTNHPIFIVHTSGHLSSANSQALELAHVTKDTPQPAGGVIRKDRVTGEPTGVIEERTSIVGRLTPAYNSGQEQEAIHWCDTEYLSKGVTTTSIMGGAVGLTPDLLKARDQGWFHLRTHVFLSSVLGEPMSLEKVAKISPVPDRIHVGGVKLFSDGSLQGYTGYLTVPYYVQPDGTNHFAGYPARARDALAATVLKYHRAGYQIAIHSNGDAAIDDVIFAFRAAQKAFPRPDARHRIEHCQTVREDQLDAIKELNLTPSFFVGHVYYWGDRHRDIFLGQERAERISPLASALKRGIRFTIHNDTPVTPVNPLLLVWCSVNRLTREGKVLGAEQRIPVFEAFRAVTRDAAWQNFEDQTRGTIEPGKFADFVVLAENPFTVDPVHLKDIAITETIVGGQPVFKK